MRSSNCTKLRDFLNQPQGDGSSEQLSDELVDHIDTCTACTASLNRYYDAMRGRHWPKVLGKAIASCLVVFVFGGAVWVAVSHWQELKDLRSALGLTKPVVFASDAPDRPSEEPASARPVGVFGEHIVIQGRAQSWLYQAELRVTPGFEPGEAEWTETQELIADASGTSPFDFTLRLPQDSRIRTIELEFKPTQEARDASPEDTRPERLTYTVAVACDPGTPRAYVPSLGVKIVRVERSGNRVDVTVQSATPAGSCVTLTSRGSQSDKPLFLRAEQVRNNRNEFSFSVQVGSDPVEIQAFAQLEGNCEDLESALETDEGMELVVVGDRRMLMPPILSAPEEIKGHECEVRIKGLKMSAGQEYFLLVHPALSPDRAWVQGSRILTPNASRVIYLGMMGKLTEPEKSSLLLVSAPANTLRTDGEIKVADFDKLGITIVDSREVERLE